MSYLSIYNTSDVLDAGSVPVDELTIVHDVVDGVLEVGTIGDSNISDLDASKLTGTIPSSTVATDDVRIYHNGSDQLSIPDTFINQALTTGSTVQFGALSCANLTVSGTTTTVDSTTVTVADSILLLANTERFEDTLDMGWLGRYYNSGDKYAGVIRDATNKGFYLVEGLSGVGATESPVTIADRASFYCKDLDCTGNINLTGNITLTGSVDGVDIASRNNDLTTAETTISNYLDQAVKTTSSPSFDNITSTGKLLLSSTTASDNIQMNVLNSASTSKYLVFQRQNSPTFTEARFGMVSDSAGSYRGSLDYSSTEYLAFGNTSLSTAYLRINTSGNVLCSGDLTATTLNSLSFASVVQGDLDWLASHDSQGLGTTDTPQFAGLTLTGNLITTALIDGVDVASRNADLATAEAAIGVLQSDVSALQTDVNGFPDALKNLTTAEINQLENIGTNTFSSADWGYLGSINQNLATSSQPTFTATTSSDGGYSLFLSNSSTGGAGIRMTNSVITTNPWQMFVAKTTGFFKIGRGALWDALTIDLSGNIAVYGTVDGVDLAAFKSDYDAKINQSLTTTSSPTFTGATIEGNASIYNTLNMGSVSYPSTLPVINLQCSSTANYGQVRMATETLDRSVNHLKLFSQDSALLHGLNRIYLRVDASTDVIEIDTTSVDINQQTNITSGDLTVTNDIGCDNLTATTDVSCVDLNASGIVHGKRVHFGYLDSPTSTGTQTITGIGFTPRHIKFTLYHFYVGGGRTIEMNGHWYDNSKGGIGSAVTYSRYSDSAYGTDYVNSAVIFWSTFLLANVSALSSDGFSLLWATVSGSYSYRIMYECYN